MAVITNTHLNRLEATGTHKYGIFTYEGSEDGYRHNGIIKLNLFHVKEGSILSPDFVLYEGKYWIQPIHFTNPILVKLDDNIIADFFIDINCGKTIKIRILKTGFIEELNDKSQLFNCEIISGIKNLIDYSCGEYFVKNNKYYLKLFHHTKTDFRESILKSQELRSSKWNIKGNKEAKKYSYCYFTNIPKIELDDDLTAIAMVNKNEMIFKTDGFEQPEILFEGWKELFDDFIYIPKVYRSSTEDRKDTVELFIPIESIDKKHIYIHYQDQRIFYEVFQPYIHRIKMKLNASIHFDDTRIVLVSDDIVYSDYAIIGDARIKEGLAAPFEEDDTTYIFKQQDCKNENILEFWFNNGNRDLFSGFLPDANEFL